MITYARKEAPRLNSVARFNMFIKVTINDLEVKASYLFCNTMPWKSQINYGSSLVMITGMFHTKDPLLFLSVPFL